MTLPNILSIFRIILVPVFPLVFFSGADDAHLWAALVYTLAAATDVLDGFLARRLHQITKLGRLLDPLADKLMAGIVVFCIAWAGMISWWAVAFVFTKEFCMALGALVLYRRGHDINAANASGKAATVVFFAVCLFLLLVPARPDALAMALVGVALAINAVAFICYLKIFLQQIRQFEK